MRMIEEVPVLDRAGRGIGRANSTLMGVKHSDTKRIAEEIRYLRRIGATVTAVVCEEGKCPVVYVKTR